MRGIGGETRRKETTWQIRNGWENNVEMLFQDMDMDCIGLVRGMGTSDRPFDGSGECSSSIKCKEFPGFVRNGFLFKDSSVWS